MKDQVTSIEQSKRLIELGVPAEKASMAWIVTGRSTYNLKIWKTDAETKAILHQKFPDGYIPAFTVADLLGLLPPKISWQDPSGIEWVVDYDRFIANDVSIINALVETIILLVSTKHGLNL